MIIFSFRKRLLSGAALGVFGALAVLGPQGEVQAASICTADVTTTPNTFNCIDNAVTPSATATGTYTEGATFGPGINGRLEISGGTLDVVLGTGQINSSDVPAVWLTASSGTLTYVSNAVTSTTNVPFYNTNLRGQSVEASTGTIVADGLKVRGVNSEATNGSSTVTGDTTTVSGLFAYGLFTAATNGSNLVNSGTVTATGQWARGVIAWAFEGTSCGTNTVNTTGNVTAVYHGIVAFGCSVSTVNVLAGTTVRTTENAGWTIINSGADAAVTNIAGSVLAPSAGDRALDIRPFIDTPGTSLTTINSSGRLLGLFHAADGADTFIIDEGGSWTSSGTSDFGLESDILVNAGTISARGETSFAGLESLSNSGTLDLQDETPGDILTTANDYAGSGAASLLIDAGATADRLVIGGAASGTTRLFVNGVGVIDTDGILVVDAGTATDGAFVLGAASATRLIDLRLERSGGDFYLFADPNAIAFQPLTIGNVTQHMWYQSADIHSGYAAHRHSDLDANRQHGVGFWGQLYGSRDRYGNAETQTAFGADVDIDNRVQTDRRGAQVGVDLLPASGGFVVGVTGGYQHAKAGHRSIEGGVDAQGYNLGAYAQFGGSTGFYGGLLLKRDWNDVRLTNSAFSTADGDPDATSTGIEGEGGFRWGSSSINFEVGAGLAYLHTKINDFSAEGIDYDFDRNKSLRGRLGARVGFGGSLAPFVDAKLFHEFDGDSGVTLLSGDEFDDIESGGRGTWARLDAGIGQQGPGLILAAWAEFGDVRGLGIRGGFRF